MLVRHAFIGENAREGATAMDRAFLYELIYALAAREGREKALFGACRADARTAFSRSMAGDAFPELWFELPLSGETWFDLHALTGRTTLEPGMTFSAHETGGYPEAFSWFAGSEGTRQLALSWDVGKGEVESPAIQLLVSTRDPKPTCEFLASVGRADAVDPYRAFAGRLPSGWFACYAGVFPQRQDHNLRVECIPDPSLQEAYAHDPALLEEHLRQTGFSAFGDTLVERCALLANTPFELEFQFDVLPDGSAGPTLGASLRFNSPANQSSWKPFDADAEAGDLMSMLESWGLADDRWRMLAGTTFAKRVSFKDDSRLLFCYPTFVKLRGRMGEPLDAKAYLIAGVQ